MDHETRVIILKEKVRIFCEDRDWDQFHDAKELAIGISTEAAELLDHFRFRLTDDISNFMKEGKKRDDITDELADIFFFVLRFSQRYNIDLTTALANKMVKTDEKYPIDKVKGKNLKYNEYNE
jgi:NTP pyrophosphatase (non-canonical NTP hydrolase)